MRKPAISSLIFAAFLLLGALVCLLMGAVTSKAHSFYPWECCHDRDCWVMGAGEREPEPRFTREGWRLHDGALVPFSEARPSPDGRFHVCRYGGADKGSVIRPAGAPVCLWVPMGAS